MSVCPTRFLICMRLISILPIISFLHHFHVWVCGVHPDVHSTHNLESVRICMCSWPCPWVGVHGGGAEIDAGNHLWELFCLTHWNRTSQANPELSDMVGLVKPLALRVHCPWRYMCTWTSIPTWHLHEFLGILGVLTVSHTLTAEPFSSLFLELHPFVMSRLISMIELLITYLT